MGCTTGGDEKYCHDVANAIHGTVLASPDDVHHSEEPGVSPFTSPDGGRTREHNWRIYRHDQFEMQMIEWYEQHTQSTID